MREPVSLEEVVWNWLRREQRKPYRDFTFHGAGSDWELVGELFCHRSFQAAFIWRYHVNWYRTKLNEQDFRQLRVIEGPTDESWRKLSPDNTIRSAAKRIMEDDLTGTYEDIDVDHIRRKAETFQTSTDEDYLTLFQSRADEPPYVVDGNHYTTAKMLFLLQGGQYTPQPVYLARKLSDESMEKY